MDRIDNYLSGCPRCGADLSYGEGGKYSRCIGMVYPRIYDGVLFWKCPDCGGWWHRWPPGHPRHAAAEFHATLNEKSNA